jgi:hypothetical protein
MSQPPTLVVNEMFYAGKGCLTFIDRVTRLDSASQWFGGPPLTSRQT